MSESNLRAVQVLIVDDDEDIRSLLRALFSRDPRFEIVGEAANGREAVDAVGTTSVDLVVLDRDMPVMNGLIALPILHERSPGVAVVLYTACADRLTRQAAIAAGAIEVLDKVTSGQQTVQQIADTLISHWASDEASMQIRVGTVASSSALLWIDNAARILDAVGANASVLDDPLDDDAMEAFNSLLELWRQIAIGEPTFYWTARARPADVDRLVRAWAAIDMLPDDRLAEIGCSWSPPEARPFFEALTSGVMAAMERHQETRQLAMFLSEVWPAR